MDDQKGPWPRLEPKIIVSDRAYIIIYGLKKNLDYSISVQKAHPSLSTEDGSWFLYIFNVKSVIILYINGSFSYVIINC